MGEDRIYGSLVNSFTTEQSPITLIQNMNSIKWGIFVAGIILFICAKTVAHRAATFYVSSAVLGVLLSIAFLGMFIKRFLPKKIFFVPIDLLGAPALSYIYYYGYSHAQEILHQNWKWLALYVTVAVIASLIICYVSEVASNDRVQNVLQWTLQSIAILLMFYSTQNIILAVTAIVLIVGIDQGAHLYIWKFFKWLTRKPETRKLLTKEEFAQEGIDYTQQELEKLRLSLLEDCRFNSPNRSFTKRCKNREQLAQFLVTSEDVSIQSQMEYQKELYPTDDEDSYDEKYRDDDSFMEVDNGTTDDNFLSDDEF